MASRAAIRLVTKALGDLLRDRMEHTSRPAVTFGLPLRASAKPPSVNLYLYSVRENPHLRNEEDPRMATGGYGRPPLALELNYLMTTYGVANNDIGDTPENRPELDAQELLADAMLVFHDAPVLNAGSQLINAPGDNLLHDDLRQEFEAIRITPRTLDLEDLTKIWTAFKEEMQRAVAYQVSVIRLERTRPRRVAAPVLQRAINVIAATAPGPSLTELRPSAAAAGQEVVLVGDRIATASLRVVLSDSAGSQHPREPETLTHVNTNGRISIAVPNDPAKFQPGPKNIEARAEVAGSYYSSEPLVLVLRPAITGLTSSRGASAPPRIRFDGATTLTIDGTLLGTAPLAPRAGDTRRRPAALTATVFIGGFAVPLANMDFAQLPAKLVITLLPASTPGLPAVGQVVSVRVRVNGTESQSWIETPAGPVPDPAQLVEVVA